MLSIMVRIAAYFLRTGHLKTLEDNYAVGYDCVFCAYSTTQM